MSVEQREILPTRSSINPETVRAIKHSLLTAVLAAGALTGAKVGIERMSTGDQLSDGQTLMHGFNIAEKLVQNPLSQFEIVVDHDEYGEEIRQIFKGEDPAAPEQVLSYFDGQVQDRTLNGITKDTLVMMSEVDTREEELGVLQTSHGKVESVIKPLEGKEGSTAFILLGGLFSGIGGLISGTYAKDSFARMWKKRQKQRSQGLTAR